MDQQMILDEVKMKLTGGILELEVSDDMLVKVINSSMRELNRYYNSTNFITLPYSNCIDLNKVKINNEETELKINSISNVYRTEGMTVSSEGATSDPMAIAQWQIVAGASNINYFQDYMYDYLSWNTLSQIRNTSSTDLAFIYDRDQNKIYINQSTSKPTNITIEYIPRLCDVEDIKSDYWIDCLVQLVVAQTKIVLGRIRSRFSQANSLWQQDTSILQEGLQEYKELVDHMKANSDLLMPID